jgi:hypothetical protein
MSKTAYVINEILEPYKLVQELLDTSNQILILYNMTYMNLNYKLI